MKPIPTAEECYNEDLSPVQNMIEFAKAHCEAQLEAILENAEARTTWSNSEGSETWVDKDSIKNAYSLTNIK